MLRSAVSIVLNSSTAGCSFLQFKFEPGHYGLVAREKLDNRDVLKIEYYPTRLFQDDPKTRTERRVRETASRPSDEAYSAEMQRLTGGRLPVVDLPDTGHHPMLDQPLALVTGLRTLLALWPAATG